MTWFMPKGKHDAIGRVVGVSPVGKAYQVTVKFFKSEKRPPMTFVTENDAQIGQRVMVFFATPGLRDETTITFWSIPTLGGKRSEPEMFPVLPPVGA